MDFWGDVGDFGSSLFTGRWTGGENSVGDVWNRDPAAVVAPVAAALTAGFGGAALAGGAFGAEAAGVGAGEAAGSVFTSTAPEATGAFGTTAVADVAATDPWAAFAAAPTSELGGATGAGIPTAGMDATSGVANLTTGGVPGAITPDAAGFSGFSAPTGTPVASGAAPSDAGSFFGKLGSSLTADPLKTAGIGVAGGLLGMDLLKGNPVTANQQNVQNTAGYLSKQGPQFTDSGRQLQAFLTSGTLPPALQAAIDQKVRAAKAMAISNAARNGQNTDPRLNTQLLSQIEDAEMQGLVEAGKQEQQLFTAGTQLINTGINETALSGQMYEWLANADKANNQQVQNAIMAFAAALGGGKGMNINLGGNRAA